MCEIQYNEATCMVEGCFFGYDFETEELPGKEDMEKIDATAIFTEYVLMHAKRCGYQETGSDTGKLVSFIKHKCDESGVVISRQNIANWLTKGIPGSAAKARDNVYRLCFALRMDLQQTMEFFLKAYLERPFNYKDIREAVYFFCFRKGLTYADAKRLIERVESMPLMENPYADNVTEWIGERLRGIETEEELVRYLTENRSGFSIQNQSATNKIKELIEDCKKIAPKEYVLNCNGDKEIRVDNIDELLHVIYGYSARATSEGKKIYSKSISKSKFPALVSQNWPQREQFQQILYKGTASYDTIRRALVMLTFYEFTANAAVHHALEDGIFEEFTDEMNRVLSECGYVQLYWRNPFDWIIGYCAMAPNPLDTLRDLIEEYYLSDLDTSDGMEM